MTDYRIYRLSLRDGLMYGALYMGLFLLLGKLFYDSFYVALSVLLFLPFLFRRKAKELLRRRQEKLALEFREFLLAFSASLKAGYSAENAISEAGRDLAYMYGENADIVRECHHMEKQLLNNHSFEQLLSEFAKRSGQDEIREFAAIFAVAKRSGGNMTAILRNTADVIAEKMEVKREIKLLYAAKRMEQGVMNMVPVAIIGYVRFTTPDYFDAMYGNPFGVTAMSICLAVYVGAYFLAQKIMDIEV